MPIGRQSIYHDLIRIELNLLEPELREIVNNEILLQKIMFRVRMLQPRITLRLMRAQNHISKGT
jgi:hypothetical protein